MPVPKHNTGELRDRITLQEPSESVDDDNRPIKVYHSKHTVWAKVMPKEQLEQYRGDQMDANASHLIVIRQPHGNLTTEWRALWGSRTLNIAKHYDPDNRGQWTEIEAGEDVE